MPEVITDHLELWTSALLTKSTAGRGSNGKLEAYGIKKLRELIMGTALRGLFDKENKSLPVAIDKDVSNARNAYYKSIGKRPKEIDYGPPLLNEFKLPSGWVWKRVGELCDLQTGATPNTHKPEYFGGDIRWLVSGDINQVIIEDCEGRITEQGLANSNCKVLPKKTVLIALNGQGKTRASVALLNVPAACNQSLVGMIPFDTAILDPMFLLLSLKYRYYEIRDITGQNQRRGLNMGLVAELSIPLPPLAEQHRIVAKVDELMALCDQLEQQQTDSLAAHEALVETLLGALTRVESQQEFSAGWARIASHFDTLFTTEASIDQLKQTILQLAVMGKLVPQDPNDEPARVLLEKIASEKEQLIAEEGIKRESSLPRVATDEQPFDIPESWEWVRLGTALRKITDGTHHSPPNGEAGEFLYISAKNIKDDGVMLSNATYVSKEIHEEIYSRCDPELGDVLYIKDGATTGIATVNNLQQPFSMLSSVALLKCPQGLLNTYLLLSLRSPYFYTEMRSGMTGVAITRVTLKKLKEAFISLPPLAEQHRIVAKVDELMALCDALKARIQDAQTTQIHLADAIVEKAVA